MNVTRILVTGSRDWKDNKHLNKVLAKCVADSEYPVIFIQGGAAGADKATYNFARQKGIAQCQVDANWDYHRKSAGPIRNSWMLYLEPHYTVAFIQNVETTVGTLQMIRQSHSVGLDVDIHYADKSCCNEKEEDS